MNQRSLLLLGNFNHRLKFSYICTDDATLNVCTSRNQIWLWEFTFSTCSFISICCSPTLRSPPCCGSQYISTEFGKCLQSTACQLGANFNMIILIRCSWNRFFKILLFVANLFLFFTLLNVWHRPPAVSLSPLFRHNTAKVFVAAFYSTINAVKWTLFSQ